ncbi:sensor histidine kinase inhibitor, KipI family [Faunimonas pinastri]|uniref:Sensor histidine kinase inhibitor, KipI family n=1 Tax=Faunimonas pinastri TaxID=1855383 RepID=A0A1H9E1N7_9HYPH|nr:5-oxoprolinase subunit PxpB [Faunimonas pinastri]SEQ19604.1 sensor histidine kinase inhibitor, KipI family [Faunimonas pinastri]
MLVQPKFSHLGTSAVLFEVPDSLSVATQRRIWALAEAAETWPHIREAVSGVTNLMLLFDEPPRSTDWLQERLLAHWEAGRSTEREGRLVEIPVDYGGAGGPDLSAVAAAAGLSPDAVVDLHCAPVYTVYAVGSHPGFAYLAELDERLFIPRRAVPLLNMPQGSVSLAGRQTGVSASAGPTGWHTIGHTDFTFFDPALRPPAALISGDRVRFAPRSVMS